MNKPPLYGDVSKLCSKFWKEHKCMKLPGHSGDHVCGCGESYKFTATTITCPTCGSHWEDPPKEKRRGMIYKVTVVFEAQTDSSAHNVRNWIAAAIQDSWNKLPPFNRIDLPLVDTFKELEP